MRRFHNAIVFVQHWGVNQVASSVLYFGPDEWNRVQVLESAGYAVHQCLKISDLESELGKSPQPAVVVMNSFGHASFVPAVELVHLQAASARIIAFPSAGESGFEKTVDLVVPPLTPPEEWLKDMAALLERSRAVQKASQAVHQQSAQLRDEAAAVRAKSVRERQRSAEERHVHRELEKAAGITNKPNTEH